MLNQDQFGGKLLLDEEVYTQLRKLESCRYLQGKKLSKFVKTNRNLN